VGGWRARGLAPVRALVAGLTGQLGHGIVETAGEGLELVPLVRPIGRRSATRRVQAAFRERPELAAATVEGDVTQRRFGLDDEAVRRLAPEIDVVLNVAGETDWAAPQRRLFGTNVLGAANGLELARALHDAGGRCSLYCYASSVHAAGGLGGRIAEAELGPDADRTPYEQSKWLGEQAVLEGARRDGGPAVAVARIGGLVGSSVTGHTVKRNSLYTLADRWDDLPRGLMPLHPRGRVDMLPRDLAADALLRMVEGVRTTRPPQPVIAHVCAGEAAPSTSALLRAVRSLDLVGARSRVRTLPVPRRPLVWATQNAERFLTLSSGDRNVVMGLRYLAIDRIFERARLAQLAGELPAPSVELLVRLVFGISPPLPEPAPEAGSLARFRG
jgi:nucleoside-diphosphate-sugar epimerase